MAISLDVVMASFLLFFSSINANIRLSDKIFRTKPFGQESFGLFLLISDKVKFIIATNSAIEKDAKITLQLIIATMSSYLLTFLLDYAGKAKMSGFFNNTTIINNQLMKYNLAI